MVTSKEKEVIVEMRIPTKEMYSYINITGTPTQIKTLTKEDLLELLKKGNNACKLARTIDQSDEEQFEQSLE